MPAAAVTVVPVTAPGLAKLPHGFLGREGGVSTGMYASLNVGLGSADDPAAVAENRRRAVAAVAPHAALVTLHQVHSPVCVSITAPLAHADRARADAMATATPNLALGILTADCAPVLLADADAGVIGAAHAGWGGALGGVIAAVVDAMTSLGARRERIAAAIGPCIHQPSYEVGDDFRARFAAADADHLQFFAHGRPGHAQFDLPGFVAARLAVAGLRDVAILPHDTYPAPARWFSYRRATHAGEPDYGRQLAVIALPA